MPETRKPTLAFFDFASCEGCQIEFTNYGDDGHSRAAQARRHRGVPRGHDRDDHRAHRHRAGRGQLHARGGPRAARADPPPRAESSSPTAPAPCTGGINALKNHQDDFAEYVYGDDARMPHLRSGTARPISAAIKVDYEVLGCPMSKEELLLVISNLLHGTSYVAPTYPVCVQCKRRETICRFDEGDYCMGQVAHRWLRRAVPGPRHPLRGLPRLRRRREPARAREGARWSAPASARSAQSASPACSPRI